MWAVLLTNSDSPHLVYSPVLSLRQSREIGGRGHRAGALRVPILLVQNEFCRIGRAGGAPGGLRASEKHGVNSRARQRQVNGNSFRTLEFDQIRALLLQHTGSVSGRRRIESLRPVRPVAVVRLFR
jgi:hypothetical protein